jgi:hypothetical protein
MRLQSARRALASLRRIGLVASVKSGGRPDGSWPSAEKLLRVATRTADGRRHDLQHRTNVRSKTREQTVRHAKSPGASRNQPDGSGPEA